jgi:hypothetical protein
MAEFMPSAAEGLQVVGPQFVPKAAEGPQVIPNVAADGGGGGGPYSRPPLPDPSYPTHTKTICGLRQPTFWLTTIILVLVTAGAVGGGVGGSIACRPCSQGRGLTQIQTQTLESQRHVSIHKFLLKTLILYISFTHQVKSYPICPIMYTSP